ncbi:MAG: T9SS type A sorting domain-containing protein [Chitinophagaceae bacterium]|nr:T9SS type A sorting domain-containing protein [Chitinophagaceae bacterium]
MRLINSANGLYYYSLNSKGWSRSAFTAIYPWSSGQALQVYNVSADIQIGENPGQIYYLGTDNRVWVLYQDINNTWQAVAINWTAINAVRNLRITSAGNVQRRLSYVGSDNQIRVFNYDYCEVLNPSSGSVTSFAVRNKPRVIAIPETNVPKDSTLKVTALKIWPNPANMQVDFSVENFIDEKVMVSIFDTKGQMVFYESRYINKSTERVTVSQLIPGAYFLHIASQNKTATGRFIKEK